MASGLLKWIFQAGVETVGLKRVYGAVANARRRDLSKSLSQRFKNTVISGPFAGMTLPSHSSWGHEGDFLGKCVGTYEANLHDALSKGVARDPEAVINVGCAEGYYSVGLAILLPGAVVYAFDTDPAAQKICQQAAVDNGVSNRLRVGGLCTPEVLSEIISKYNRLLIVLDCEGAELELVDPSKVPGLSRCDLLIELHDFVVPGVTEKLRARLNASHQLVGITQGGRNPNIEELSIYSEDDRWLMVSEQRPILMNWLACWALPPRS